MGEEGVYECAICGEQFPGINLLGQHCQVHMEENNEGGGRVQEHMENHEGGGGGVCGHIEGGVRVHKESQPAGVNNQLDRNILKSL